MMQPPDFSKAKTPEELNRIAEDYLRESRAWGLWMRRCSTNLRVLWVYWIVGSWVLGLQILTLLLMEHTPHITVVFLYCTWLTFGFFVRGKLQDIARECGGIWVNGDFTVPK
jgi:hypothetical protein